MNTHYVQIDNDSVMPPDWFFETFKPTPGAISCAEACGIFNLASKIPLGTCVDIGSHAGKAAMSAAAGLVMSPNRTLFLIDPIFDMKNREAWSRSDQKSPENNPWKYSLSPMFNSQVKSRIVHVSQGITEPILVGDYSERALEKIHSLHGNFAWAFIDSDQHQEELVMAEVKILEDGMVKGGFIVAHDYGNQFIAPKVALDYLVSTGKFEAVNIPWETIKRHVSERGLEKGNNSWHMTGVEMPCFVGAVRRV